MFAIFGCSWRIAPKIAYFSATGARLNGAGQAHGRSAAG